MDEIDIDWFEKQERYEKTYDIFYEKPISFVWISILYIKNYGAVDIIRKKHNVYNNKLTGDDIESFISKHRTLRGTKYRLYAMAMFNATISPKQILASDYSTDYFTPLNKLQDVMFHDTISYFHDDNEFFIVLSSQKNVSSTRRSGLMHCRKTRRTN